MLPSEKSDNIPTEKVGAQKARRERKRANDRVAQQMHRMRQKQQVKELKAQIELIKNQSGEEQLKSLMSDNEKLREELKALRIFFSTIEAQVQKHKQAAANADSQALPVEQRLPTPPTALNAHGQSQFSSEEEFRDQEKAQSDIGSSNSTFLCDQDPLNSEPGFLQFYDHAPFMNGTPICVEKPPQPSKLIEISPLLDQPDFCGSADFEDAPLQAINEPMNILDLAIQSDATDQARMNNDSNLASLSPLTTLQDPTTSFLQNPFCESYWEGFTAPELCQATSDSALQEANLSLDEIDGFKQSANISTNIAFPLYMPPGFKTSQWHFENDLGVYTINEIIRKGRSYMTSQQSLLQPPTLADVLTEKPKNMLVAEIQKLMEHLNHIGRNGTYIGISWVLYLLLHWHITQTSRSIERLPSWLRPTQLQLEVPHPITIDFIAWPKLRNELIIFAQREPERLLEIISAIAEHSEFVLEPKLARSCKTEKDLNAAVGELKNWRLNRNFFKVYPQWEAAYKSQSNVSCT